MPDTALIDIAVKLLLLVITIVVGVISYFLKMIYTDFRDFRDRLEATDKATEKATNTACAASTDVHELRDDLEKGQLQNRREIEKLHAQINKDMDYLRIRIDRLDEHFVKQQSDTSAILSALQTICEEMPRIRADITEVKERLSRLEAR